ncbi:hypothetical protein IEQ34_000256 [Dendrobium chrysotoxum]|uniref:Uncharacterized protein n=1 Tax=Dendrobium chrysotoxum TaxID=161865 RepID=A0AAV7HR23_DENCH|nr:hypothetical protein IEQ34_000256 [Dendrobium chrysotoxum]
MDDFPAYCVHCNLLGHSKVECHILHPPLNKSTYCELPLVVNGSSEPLALDHVAPAVLDADLVPDLEVDDVLVVPVAAMDVLVHPMDVMEGVDVSKGCALVGSPTVVENGFVSVDNKMEVLLGHCEANTMVVIGSEVFLGQCEVITMMVVGSS